MEADNPVQRNVIEKVMVQPRRKNVIPDVAACGRVRALCLALPDTTETDSWGHPNFRVGKKAFVTLEVHRGRPSIAIRLVADQVQELCADGVFFPTPHGKGLWASIHADQRMNWRLVGRLMSQSHEMARSGA